MQRPSSLVLSLLTLVAALALPALAGCGQKGPLSLPPPASAASGPGR